MYIYGVEYKTPTQPKKDKIGGHNKFKKEQFFQRTDIPDIFDEMEYGSDEEPLYTQKQMDFIDQELDRIDNGYWFYNNGEATYITGLHYFYLNYWILENGERPDYRDCDRRYFCFQDYCEKEANIYGVIRAKKRREGATSQGSADLVKTAITQERAFCGIVSKTGKDAKNVFLTMIRNGFQSLPIFLQPRVEDPDSQEKLLFRKPKDKSKKGNAKVKGKIYTDSKGLGSVIDYRNTQLNSYDSGRLTKALIEEGGKWPTEVPINDYWPIVNQTLKMGAKKVGFALLPSTSNKLTKGGKGFKILWDDSNQFENPKTGSGLYRYFSPAEDGLVPFIDKYGMSILDEPTREQALWMKQYYGAGEDECRLGAIKWLDLEYDKIKDPNARNEFKRMYPRSERDAFDFENSQNIYSLDNILEQKEYLMTKRIVTRKVRFYRKSDGTADFVDDQDANWEILYLPEKSEINSKYEKNSKLYPGNAAVYSITVDPFKNTFVSGKGSKGGAFIWKKFNPTDPENSGLPIAMYWGRPKLKRHFHEQMLLAAEYYGAELCYESDYDDYLEFLMENNKFGYAKERPKNTIDPNRKVNSTKKEYGVKSGDGFSYTMMIERSVEYVIQHCKKIYFYPLLEQLEEYDESERTLFDLAVAFQLGTVVISDPIKKKATEIIPKSSVIRTFKLIQ